MIKSLIQFLTFFFFLATLILQYIFTQTTFFHGD